MTELDVELGARSYPVVVGKGALTRVARRGPLTRVLGGRRAFVVADDRVWPLWGERALAGLTAAGAQPLGHVAFPAGEANKTLDTARLVWDALVAQGVERRDCVVALGGGVVGDVAGFAAATYLRGVDFVQLPTTLLAMVDSSVGGKTGVDHPQGKNLIGAFHQPRAVVADLEVLTTLPRREVLAGAAEILKAALLGDPGLFARLEAAGPGCLEDLDSLEAIVARAVAIKAGVVAADEREAGPRAILNLGHTYGHAVEVAAGYGRVPHGEAVALGLVFAAELSAALGFLDPGVAARIRELVQAWGYPLMVADVSAEKILEALRFDKKGRDGAPRWVVLREIGRPQWGVGVPPDRIETLVAEFQGNR